MRPYREVLWWISDLVEEFVRVSHMRPDASSLSLDRHDDEEDPLNDVASSIVLNVEKDPLYEVAFSTCPTC